MIICDIKCTFRIKQPTNIRIHIDKKSTEEDFVRKAFEKLTLGEVRQLDRLICLDVDGLRKNLSYLGNTDCCYYFSIDVNDDEETRKWHNFKTEHLDKKRRLSRIRHLCMSKTAAPCLRDCWFVSNEN
jgi:hypothetical protein